MKIFKIILMFKNEYLLDQKIYFFILITFLNSCSWHRDVDSILLKGRLVEYFSEEPLRGIKIEATLTFPEITSIQRNVLYTDQNGYFSIEKERLSKYDNTKRFTWGKISLMDQNEQINLAQETRFVNPFCVKERKKNYYYVYFSIFQNLVFIDSSGRTDINNVAVSYIGYDNKTMERKDTLKNVSSISKQKLNIDILYHMKINLKVNYKNGDSLYHQILVDPDWRIKERTMEIRY